MKTGIRPYGPGKFDSILDYYVYGASLDGGPDEECGDVQAGAWYGLMRDPILSELPADLTMEEIELLASSVGAILSEDSQGLVSVEYFDDASELAAAWRECEKATETDETDEE